MTTCTAHEGTVQYTPVYGYQGNFAAYGLEVSCKLGRLLGQQLLQRSHLNMAPLKGEKAL